MHLRSVMARNALLCLNDLALCGTRILSRHFETTVPLLVQRSATEKHFIRDLARQVLEACVSLFAGGALLAPLLATSSREKNAQAVAVVS